MEDHMIERMENGRVIAIDGIFIPDIKMPDTCEECLASFFSCCHALPNPRKIDVNIGKKKRMEWCPMRESRAFKLSEVEDDEK
jgi:hypothetical protein